MFWRYRILRVSVGRLQLCERHCCARIHRRGESPQNMSSIWTQTIKQSDDVLHQELSGETVLLNLKTEHYFGLDPVGTRIWQVLGETSSAERVVQQLLTEYEVDENTLRADVERLIGELSKAGLLRTAETEAV